jgi:hypothetical protein
VDGFGVRLLGIGNGRPGFGEIVASHGTQRLAHRHVDLQGRPVIHWAGYMTLFCETFLTIAPLVGFSSRVMVAT